MFANSVGWKLMVFVVVVGASLVVAMRLLPVVYATDQLMTLELVCCWCCSMLVCSRNLVFAAVVVAELLSQCLWTLSKNQPRVISCPGLFDNCCCCVALSV